MQMCKTWLSNQLATACWEDASTKTPRRQQQHLLLVEQWLDEEAMNSHLSSEQFRAAIGAINVLGKLTDIHLSEAMLIEGG
jgi:quinol monooxygenase YgiN